MISRSQNRQQVRCGYGLRKKKRAPRAPCAIRQSHEKTALRVEWLTSSCRVGVGRGRHGAMSGRHELGRHTVGSRSMSARPSILHDAGL